MIFDQSPIHFKAPLHEGLHIIKLKPNKSLKFQLPSFKALITHLHNNASIASFRLMRPRPSIPLFAQQSNYFNVSVLITSNP
jgi:hypothetical protein